MTVHKAKGLEFPVVDPGRHHRQARTGRGVASSRSRSAACARIRIGGWSPLDLLLQQPIEQAREREEGVRVAYVAATRARDLLVVPAIGDQPYSGGWTGPLDAAIYPPSETASQPRLAAPDCPTVPQGLGAEPA